VETDEIRVAKSPEIEREAAGDVRAGAHPADARSILALQRSAGNRAVGSLLEHAPRDHAGAAGFATVPLQRQPDGPPPDEWTPGPVQWPEEAEGERNQPCFGEEAKASIGLGTIWATSAVEDLSGMPPDLAHGQQMIAWALGAWEGAYGDAPGQAALGEAAEMLRDAGSRVSTLVEPVGQMLDKLTTAALSASGDASAAATVMTEAASADEEPRPCFDASQQAIIADAVNLADAAATELSRRPPDYRQALATLKGAASRLASLGGEQPGQAKLSAAVAMLDRVIASVDAYLTPVESVVAEAAATVRSAVSRANEASEMAKRGRYAPGEGEPPEGG
jgi:hypothetical protein